MLRFPVQIFRICPRVKLLFCILLLCFSGKTQPIPIEIMVGHQRVFGSSLIIKPFKDSTRFGFFGFTNFHGSYDNKSNELVTTNQLTFRLAKGFNLAGGLSFNGLTQFFPYAGFQYTYLKENTLLVLNQGAEFIFGVNSATFAIAEWRPVLSPKTNLFLRFQGLLIYNFSKQTHQRSFAYFRLGLNSHKCSYGLGMNLDYYGTEYFVIPNYGAFVRYDF